MISYPDALKLVVSNVPKPQVAAMPVEKTIGHILAQDIISPIEMPPFNKSAMDGYALKACDTYIAPVQLKCRGEVKAGEVFRGMIKKGECLKIMTGASLPRGADSVVMIEHTRQVGDMIEILPRLKKWKNVCKCGEDIKRGEVVLKKGEYIDASHVAVAATVGKKEILVFRKPEVALLSTGNEIRRPGESLKRGGIYDANGPLLGALLEKEAIRYKFIGVAKDRAGDLERKIKSALKKDIILISGGVSMGDYDLVPGVLSHVKVKKIFHKVNIKPGRPIFFGTLYGKFIFGIPGNPVSNLLAFYTFVKPAIDRFKGHAINGPSFLKGILAKDFKQKSGRCHFVLAKIKRIDSRFYLYPVSSHGSADILAGTNADGFMKIGARYTFVKKGQSLEFISWQR